MKNKLFYYFAVYIFISSLSSINLFSMNRNNYRFDKILEVLYSAAESGDVNLFEQTIDTDLFICLFIYGQLVCVENIIIQSFYDKNGFEFRDVPLLYCLMHKVIEGCGDSYIACLLFDLGLERRRPYYDLFFKAIRHGHFDLVQVFLENIPTLKEEIFRNMLYNNVDNCNTLHYAVISKKNKLKMVKLFFHLGAKILARNNDGDTPLESFLRYCKDFDKQDLLIVDEILSKEGYFATEVNVSLMRENKLKECGPSKNLDLILDKIAQRQKETENKKYTLGNMIWNNSSIKSKDIEEIILKSEQQNYTRSFIYLVRQKNAKLVSYFLKKYGDSINYITKIKAVKIAISQGSDIAYKIIESDWLKDLQDLDDDVWGDFFYCAAINNNIKFISYFIIRITRFKGDFLYNENNIKRRNCFCDLILEASARNGNKKNIEFICCCGSFSFRSLCKSLFVAIESGHSNIIDFITEKYSFKNIKKEKILRDYDNKRLQINSSNLHKKYVKEFL